MFGKAIILVGSKFSQICATFYFNNLFFNLFVCKQPSTAFFFHRNCCKLDPLPFLEQNRF
jgi:hypothetical protein